MSTAGLSQRQGGGSGGPTLQRVIRAAGWVGALSAATDAPTFAAQPVPIQSGLLQRTSDNSTSACRPCQLHMLCGDRTPHCGDTQGRGGTLGAVGGHSGLCGGMLGAVRGCSGLCGGTLGAVRGQDSPLRGHSGLCAGTLTRPCPAGALISHDKLLLQLNPERELGDMSYKLGQVSAQQVASGAGSSPPRPLRNKLAVLCVCRGLC